MLVPRHRHERAKEILLLLQRGTHATSVSHSIRLPVRNALVVRQSGALLDLGIGSRIVSAADLCEIVDCLDGEQLDLQALHRVRERLVRQRTSVINQIRAFLLERGVAVRQGLRALRTEMPNVLAMTDMLSPRYGPVDQDLWPRLAPSR